MILYNIKNYYSYTPFDYYSNSVTCWMIIKDKSIFCRTIEVTRHPRRFHDHSFENQNVLERTIELFI